MSHQVIDHPLPPVAATSPAGMWSLVVFIGLIALIGLISCIFFWPRRIAPSPEAVESLDGLDAKDRIELADGRRKMQNDIRSALLQGFAGLALLLGLLFTWQQQRMEATRFHDTLTVARQQATTAEDGLVTERFKSGTEELGAKDDNVRAGGIYTLYQVEKVSLASHDTFTANAVYTIILSFVRVNLCNTKNPDDPAETHFVGPPRSVVAALQVLHESSHKIDLNHLRGCDGADLADVNLTGADLTDAHLNGVTFEGAKLNGADLSCANLRGTNLTHKADLTGANFKLAEITDDGFEGSRGLTKDQIQSAYWDLKDRLPSVDGKKKKALIRRGPLASVKDLRRKMCQSI